MDSEVRRLQQKFSLLIDERMLGYHLGDSHPMNSNRLFPALHLLRENFVNTEDFELVLPGKVDRQVLLKAHDEDYVKKFEELSETGEGEAPEYGLGTSDCPIFRGVSEASELIVGSTTSLAESMYQKDYGYAFILMGGLHHARSNRASGFCYYNDINVAIKALQSKKPDIKILYLDTDLHHGDGTQFDFFNDPNILTVSFHESGEYLFPGTGFPNEVGENEGEGFSVNMPLMPYTWDEMYLQRFREIVPVMFESFRPDFVIWQAGVDGHKDDPLGHLQLTSGLYRAIAQEVRQLAESTMDAPRVLSLGGGGYNPNSVARSWANVVSGLSGHRLPDKASAEWVELCSARGIEVTPELHESPSQPSEEYLYDVIAGNERYEFDFRFNIGRYFSV